MLVLLDGIDQIKHQLNAYTMYVNVLHLIQKQSFV